jgi:hypothetical protein
MKRMSIASLFPRDGALQARSGQNAPILSGLAPDDGMQPALHTVRIPNASRGFRVQPHGILADKYAKENNKMKNQKFGGWIGLLAGALVFAGCVAVPQAAPAAEEPRVYFANIEDGAMITSPATVTMASENFVVVPAGEPKAGEGHLHIMVDVHLHYGQGQLEADLTLTPGEHTLCLQAADGAHLALPGEGMRQQIAVTVQ